MALNSTLKTRGIVGRTEKRDICMEKKQILLVIVGLILLGIVGGIVFKLFAKVPEVEDTPIGTHAGVWAEDQMAAVRAGLWKDQ
jgi:hypothetical protein